MKTGARNDIVGTVEEMRVGDLMAIARVRIPAEVLLSSVMTVESLESLDLSEGDTVKVLVKAVNVLLVKE